jgi:hypothetical protein
MERDEQSYQSLIKIFRALKLFGLTSFVILNIYLALVNLAALLDWLP